MGSKCRPLVTGCRNTGDFPCHLYSLEETLVLPSVKCWTTVNSQLFLSSFFLSFLFFLPFLKRFKESISGVNEIFIFRAGNWQNKNDFYLGEHLSRFLRKTSGRGIVGWGDEVGRVVVCVQSAGQAIDCTLKDPFRHWHRLLPPLPGPRCPPAPPPLSAIALVKGWFPAVWDHSSPHTPTQSLDRGADKWSHMAEPRWVQ